MNHTFHPTILRAYDIRGTYGKTLFDADATLLGHKIATYLQDASLSTSPSLGIVRDGRHSSPSLYKGLCEALLSTGINVIDLGVGPSPLAYFASHVLPVQGVIVITASHNPKDDNGFKILLMGKNLCGEDLLSFAALPNAPSARIKGTLTQVNLLSDYADHTCSPAPKNAIKIAWDFSHGAMTVLRPFIEKNVPGSHVFLCDTLDGDFPSHPPDPTQSKNLVMLRECIVKNTCHIGFAFDGDGDRLGVVDHTGTMIDGDRLVTILASDVLNHYPGATIIADIKSSRVFGQTIKALGGVPVLSRSGHSFIKTKMKENGALLAGEMSGHIFYADENYGYDDGLYAACRVLRLLHRTGQSIHTLNAILPIFSATPEIQIPVEGSVKFNIIEQLQIYLHNRDILFNDGDGVRFDTDTGWWLVRASNTQDILVVRMEGDDDAALNAIRLHFYETLREARLDHYFHGFV
ncbi:MAG: phosphomannomutase/phosphoglucomutase [Alphaproteobacteria bacterium]|nr:phosphomannomutase/phosphoglucomutase [Alphaproteobacteria bacterium]